ncbi:Spy/CpxP family protein refolding chaperone [Pelagibacterium xiamenense]|uniref:Spy/CpxP family protein refolding chaperone n=1 Tax=Pelagibacterium xiamenense TaxID=2901140 RepID=UPI001E36E54F|nr:Spy/CpxP family protein refolding chaperone [Pelagibacterium xiamenense]MCD7061133.1 Spy/CpxP family protein refolding chaperone [Pelagibacterium xiamenense]
MTTLKKSALLVLATGVLTVGALAPAAYAQAPANDWRAERIEGGDARAFRPGNMGGQRFQGGPRMQGGILAMLVSAPDAQALDIAAVRLTHQLDLTGDQVAALDALKTAALEAREDLDAAREAIAPLEGDPTAEDITARYANMVAMTTARAEALEAVQPAFEAFVNSLEDDQVALLAPQHPHRPGQAPDAEPEAATQTE